MSETKFDAGLYAAIFEKKARTLAALKSAGVKNAETNPAILEAERQMRELSTLKQATKSGDEYQPLNQPFILEKKTPVFRVEEPPVINPIPTKRNDEPVN